MTEGNSHQRYIGVTDEPLCEEGRKLLEKFTYPAVQALICKPSETLQGNRIDPVSEGRAEDSAASCRVRFWRI